MTDGTEVGIFIKRGRFQKGNKFWKLNKDLGKTKGRKHPPDCKHCKAARTGNKFDRKAWMQSYGKVRQLKKFGLTEEQYDQMLVQQNGVCKICERPSRGRCSRLAVDHDHKTGKIRGLLCMVCNTRLGFLEKYWEKLHSYLAQ